MTVSMENAVDRFEACLRQASAMELRRVVNKRRDDIVTAVFDAGVDTIYGVYEQLHMPGQGVGGYHQAIISLVEDARDSLNNLRHAMERAAEKLGSEGGFTPEHAAIRVARQLDSYLFGFECEERAKEYGELAAELPDVWKLRVREAIENAVEFTKSRAVRSANRAVKRFGYDALLAARNAWFAAK